MIVEAKAISKSFPGVRSLDRVDFSVSAGEVRALVGENGAGKSTLIKIIAGAYTPDEGELHFDGRHVKWSSPHEAQAAGIHVIYQELVLFPEMTIAQNIFVNRQPRNGLRMIDYRAMKTRAKALLGDLGRPGRTARDAARRLSNIAAQQHSEFHGRLDLLSVDRSGPHYHHGGRDLRREGEAGVSEPISGELSTGVAASAFPTGQLLSKYGLLGFLVTNVLVVSGLSPAFLKPENIANVLTQAAPLGIVVLGQTFVLLVGGVDLSVASVMATSAVIATGFAATDNRMVPLIFAAAIELGLVVGLVNGFLVAKRNVSPFLATLATTIVLQGLRFLYTQGSTGSTLPSAFALMGQGDFSVSP
jgi:ABC-type Fe3+/spermidine/putrescine transport system ATPase subunit